MYGFDVSNSSSSNSSNSNSSKFFPYDIAAVESMPIKLKQLQQKERYFELLLQQSSRSHNSKSLKSSRSYRSSKKE